MSPTQKSPTSTPLPCLLVWCPFLFVALTAPFLLDANLCCLVPESKSNCSSLPQLFPTAEARTSRMFSNDPTSTPATSKHSLSCKGGKSIWCGKGVKKKDYIECRSVMSFKFSLMSCTNSIALLLQCPCSIDLDFVAAEFTSFLRHSFNFVAGLTYWFGCWCYWLCFWIWAGEGRVLGWWAACTGWREQAASESRCKQVQAATRRALLVVVWVCIALAKK